MPSMTECPSSSTATTTSKSTSSLRVLVIDDYEDAAQATAMLLELLGHECRIASSGTAGLEEAARFHPQLVIVDIGLPDINGYDVARELRQRADGAEIHLTALTGWGQPADRLKSIAAGFDQHFLKPADAEKLETIIRTARIGIKP